MNKVSLRRVFAPFFFVVFSLALFSCSNMSGGGESSSKNSYPVVRFVANMQSDLAAAPQEISGLVSASAGTESFCDDGISRSAIPEIAIDAEATTGVKYYVEAETGTKGTDSYKRHFVSGTSSTLELPLESGRTWNVTCGIGVIAADSEAPDDPTKGTVTTVYMSDSDPSVTISPDNPVYTKTFGLKPSTEGSGKIELDIYAANDSDVWAQPAGIDFVWPSEWGEATVRTFSADHGNYKWTLKTKDDQTIPSGVYEIQIKFFDEDLNLIYVSNQTINVFDNMKTNKWLPDGEAIDSDGKFLVTKDLVDNFLDTTLYVGKLASLSTRTDITASNDNAGTAYTPLKTLQGAISKIKARGTEKDYRIYISGEILGSTIINDLTTAKAKSITIEGYSGDNTKDVLKYNGGSNPVVIVDTLVPITFRNIKITGCNDPASTSYAGGIAMPSEMDSVSDDDPVPTVNLESGVLITGNKGGVSLGKCCVLNIKGASIDENAGYGVSSKPNSKINFNSGSVSNNTGKGFNVDSGRLKMTGGEIIGNVNNSGEGGGIWAKGTGCNVSISGGTIKGNQAKYGGGVHVRTNAEFYMTGGVMEGNTASTSGGAICGNDFTVIQLSGNAQIKNNEAPCGGAVRIIEFLSDGGIFSLGESVYIPYGVDGSKDVGKNDVSVTTEDNSETIQKITLMGNLNRHSKNDPIMLAGDQWVRGYKIIQAANGASDISSCAECFATNYGEWYVRPHPSQKAMLVLDAPIFVRETNPVADPDGTKAKPYASIQAACEAMTNPDMEFTVKIDGTLYNKQTIPNTLKTSGGTYNAKSLVICGANGLETSGDKKGQPKDALDNKSGSMQSGTRLAVKTTVPVYIKDLKITGGSGENPDNTSTMAECYGGGVIVGNSTVAADVTLLEGALITGNNNATYGGGVAVIKGELKIQGAVIKSNSAQQGGGVYVANVSSAKFYSGSIESNTGTSNGGGVFSGSSFEMFDGAVIKQNEAKGASGLDGGGGVYVGQDASLTMTGGEISGNEATTNHGGAVFVYEDGGMSIGGSAYIPAGNEGKNDVWLWQYPDMGHVSIISLTSSLTKHSKVDQIKVGLEQYVIGTTVVQAASPLTEITSDDKDCFVLTAEDTNLRFPTDSVASLVIEMPFFVKQGGTPAELGAADGTRSKPFASIWSATDLMLDGDFDYTILILGTLEGRQQIPPGQTAKSITIRGDSSNGVQDGLDGKGCAFPVLMLEGSGHPTDPYPPIIIENIKITGGNNTSGNGGGLYIKNAEVTLGADVNITGNKAQYGGGVYVDENGELKLSENVIVKNNSNDSDAASNVYLTSGKTITVEGPLVKTGDSSKKADIGVSSADAPTLSGGPVTITSGYGYKAGGYNAGVLPGVYFRGDKYGVTHDGDSGTGEAVLAVTGGTLTVDDIYEDVKISIDKTFTSTVSTSKKFTFTTTAVGDVSYSYILTYYGDTVPQGSGYYTPGTGTEQNTVTLGDSLPTGPYAIIVNATYKDTTYSASFDINYIQPAGFTEAPVIDGDYVYFGDFPQALKADSVIIDASATITHGGFDYVLGNDGAWYAQYNSKYYKIEPIKWRVITYNYNGTGKTLLLAEKIIYKTVSYFDNTNNRTIDSQTVKPFNYEHSRMRAYLNGLSYYSSSAEQNAQFEGKGFLQSAFTEQAQTKIAVTEVLNDSTGNNTNDKVFILSKPELERADFGFADDNSRKRTLTSYTTEQQSYHFAIYWTRTTNGSGMYEVGSDGKFGTNSVNRGDFGIVPAICLE